MKKLLNKLLITIMIVVLLFNFVFIPQSKALILDGGILMKPFTSFALVILDNIAFAITMAVGVMSNGMIDWVQDWGQDAISALQDSWSTDQSLINNAISTLETATEITGMGFLTIEDFFRNELEISNINIFKHMPSGNVIDNVFDDREDNENSVINAVKISVASWYYALRNIAAVGLLCVLIYVAIRILLSTVAEDKAHYKDLLVDWVKAACLVILAHVLMMMILNIGDYIVEIFTNMTSRYSSIAWVRSKLILDWDATQIMYLIMYGMLIYYTIVFTISYIKRFLYTMLLIIIAPIVALVYAFGKEGKNIFNKWLKEFVLNAFLQPYHMLIYTVLFGFVTSIASEGNGFNSIYITIYSLIVLHFIKDAEKYYRGLFGMNEGVAGIGQSDTGVKTIEKVVKKTTQAVQQVAKVGLSVATLAIPGGAALGSAANAAQGAQAANAANAAQDIGNVANGFGGDDSPGLLPDGGPDGPDGPDGGPDNFGGGGNTFGVPNRDEPLDGLNPDETGTGNNGQGTQGIEDNLENQNMRGQNLEVATVIAQSLESGQGNIRTVDSSIMDVAALDAGGLRAGFVDANSSRTNNHELKDEMTGRVEKTRTVIGSAFDTIAGTNIGSTAAQAMNKGNEIYQSRLAMGESPEEARRNAALLGLDAAINGKEGDIVGGIYTVNGQGNDARLQSGDGGTYAITDNSSSSATLNLESKDNSIKKVEAKNETVVKPTGTSGGNVNITQGASQAAMERMIKDTMKEIPGMDKLPSGVADQIAGDVAKELGKSGMNDIDMKDFEGLVKDAMGKLNPSEVTIDQVKRVENIEEIASATIKGNISDTGKDNAVKLDDSRNLHPELTDGK